jgi:hypothetical protein
MTEALEEIWYNELGFCGCGLPDETRDWLADILSAIDSKEFNDIEKAVKEKPWLATAFLMYVLDAAGYTEHGSSVGRAWLTDKGKEALAKLKAGYGEEMPQ